MLLILMGIQVTATDATKATAYELLDIISARIGIGYHIDLEDIVIIPIAKMGIGFHRPGREVKR